MIQIPLVDYMSSAWVDLKHVLWMILNFIPKSRISISLSMDNKGAFGTVFFDFNGKGSFDKFGRKVVSRSQQDMDRDGGGSLFSINALISGFDHQHELCLNITQILGQDNVSQCLVDHKCIVFVSMQDGISQFTI